jgi:hypothetical protein
MPVVAARFYTRNVQSLAGRVKAMRSLVLSGLRDPEMRRVALAVAAGDTWTLRDFASRHGYRPLDLAGLRSCAARDDLCELGNFFNFVRDNVRYTGDITGIDTYTGARTTIFKMRAGDCDDHFIAHATLAGHNGFGVIARCVAARGVVDASGRPVIGHIYALGLVEKFNPTRGVALDTTLPGSAALGTEPDHVERRDFRVL